MHQSVPPTLHQRRHGWDASSFGCHCFCRNPVSIGFSWQFTITTVFPGLDVILALVALVEWTNWLLLVLVHHLDPEP